MKKFLLVIALAAVIATGTAFAEQHPADQFAIGAVFNYGIGIADYSLSGAGLALKIPNVPIFWTVNLGLSGIPFAEGALSVGLSADYYFIDKTFLPDAGLGWFLGGGVFFNWVNWSYHIIGYYDYTQDNLAFGARVPVGISWHMFPIIEVFANAAPSLGLYVDGKYKVGNVEHGGTSGLYWGVPLEIGARFWL